METMLVWTLVIAAIAIIIMLVLLIASERELKRKRADVESPRSRSDETGSGATDCSVPGQNTADCEQLATLRAEQSRTAKVALGTLLEDQWTSLGVRRANRLPLLTPGHRYELLPVAT